MDHGSLVGLAFVVIVFGLPMVLGHRRKMAQLNAQSSTGNAELFKRVEALEAKCAVLQEQVNAAHQLIHDEQRTLDRKLVERLEESEFQTPARDRVNER